MNPEAPTMEISDAAKLPDRPVVSVVLIAYRHEKFVAQAIEGILAQECDFPFEVIIGEDCSPDRTGEIVRDYQRRFPHLIRIISARENVGMHANVDRSIAAARGQYVALCDGDDYWHHPRKLQMQRDMMASDPGMTLCHTDYDRLTRVRRHRSVHRNHPSRWIAKGNAYLALLHEWSVMTATSMYRTDVLKRFAESEYHNTQWGFYDRNRLLFASLHGTVGYVDESTATYRKIRGSACNSTKNSSIRMKQSVEECLDLFLARHPVGAASRVEIMAIQKRRLYSAAFLAGDTVLMEQARHWLETHNCRFSEGGHGLRRAIIASRLPLKLIQSTRNMLDLHVTAIQP